MEDVFGFYERYGPFTQNVTVEAEWESAEYPARAFAGSVFEEKRKSMTYWLAPFFLVFMPLLVAGQTQQSDIPKPYTDTVLDFDQMPEAGYNYQQYLRNQLFYPTAAAQQRIEGLVYVKFLVRENGIIENVEIQKGLHPALDAEAARVVKGMPPWKPGLSNGKPTSVRVVLPIRFKPREMRIGSPPPDTGGRQIDTQELNKRIEKEQKDYWNVYRQQVAKEVEGLYFGWEGFRECNKQYFERKSREKLVHMDVDLDENTGAILIFPKTKCMVYATPGKESFRFANVPLNEKAMVVYVQSASDRKHIYSAHALTTCTGAVPLAGEYQPLTRESIQVIKKMK